MVEPDKYEEWLDVIESAKKKGLVCVLVFQPKDVLEDSDDPESPSMVVSTHEDANLIAAMLGNYTGANS